MTACDDCNKAKSGPWVSYRGGCQSCAARMVASSEQAKDARAARAQTKGYRHMIKVFGVTHGEVKQWLQR